MTKLVTQSLMSVCAILLLHSSLEHLSNPFRFLDGVMAYKLVPFSTARFIATSLPAVSLLTGIALMTTSMRLGGLAMTVLLGLMFVSVQTTALMRDLAISCGCFDPFRSEEVSLRSLVFPATLCLSAAVCFWLEMRHAKA